MTPESPNPSMHDVMTGFFVPGTPEKTAKITAGFGATINIINGKEECGKQTHETAGAVGRYTAFTNLLTEFGLPYEAGVGCASMWNSFPWDGQS